MTALTVTFTIIVITQVLPCFEHCDARKQMPSDQAGVWRDLCLSKDSRPCRQSTVRMAKVFCRGRFALFSFLVKFLSVVTCSYHHGGSPDVPTIAEPTVGGNSILSGQAAAHAHRPRSPLCDGDPGPSGHACAAARLLTIIHGSHLFWSSLCNDKKWRLTR